MPDSAARSAFPMILKEYMNHEGLSQMDIAKSLHVSKQTVSEWVNGKKFPRVDKMQQLADLFGVLMSDMYTPSRSVHRSAHNLQLSATEQLLIDNYRDLSPDGQKLLVDRSEELKILHGKKQEAPVSQSV